MHGYSNNKYISDVLKTYFDKKCKPKLGKNPLNCIKSMDPMTLPSCSKLLLQYKKWACYVAHLYSTAYDAYPAFDLFSVEYGYTLSENGETLEMHWFDGNHTQIALKSLKMLEMKEINLDVVDVDYSNFENDENNDEFDDTQI